MSKKYLAKILARDLNGLNLISLYCHKSILKVSDIKLARLYSQSDFYISVSKYEGFGMSLANSLIAKKPIITFYTKTINQTLKNKGVLYFYRFNVKYLQKLILENCFNKHNFKKLKENVKKNNRYFLTPEESAIKFIKILKNA